MRATSSSSGGFGARQRNWLGRWDRCRACVSTGRWAFYPIGNKSAARSCQTTIATQSIRRMPCGQQIAKPAYSCLTIKNQNHYQLASLRSQLAAARFLRKSDTVNTRRAHALVGAMAGKTAAPTRMQRATCQACQAPSFSGNVLSVGKPRLIAKLHRHQARVGVHLRGPSFLCER